MLKQLQELINLDEYFIDGSHNHIVNLHTTSLWFRLLRQDIFHKFANKEGKFKGEHVNDVEGMLSLYEAAHWRVNGEHLLDEGLSFTTTHLAFFAAASTIANPFLAEQKELSDISRWWKDLDFASKLPFARDRVVECYFWILGVYFEPQYALARRIVTKVMAVTSVIDDIYDVYATFDELQVFTEAIERWDVICMNQLPEYMKYCYQALLDVYEEIEQLMTKEGRSYSVYYAKEEMKKLTRVYFTEAKWLKEKYIPTLDEYMELSLGSCGYSLLTTTSFLGMGDIATKEVFHWVSNGPRIVKASSTICRLMDDVVDHKEHNKGHGDSASSVECYMNKHGVSEEEACDELRKQVVDAWKDINEECVEPRDVPMALLMRPVNLARVMDVFYKDGDGYTHAAGPMKTFISSLLVHPIPI
ncbi:hypothetical protein FNV43_RR00637 [Rhamnella rubrinervis]|uniref:Sesquiterpene synthase n=1 Tax=Rhamnella rubrinervis TaxID=2594499 RepID=A0A8K0HPI9_9ROSA|nr:hypothetical protein FNV43_RR00637 [Rhamnella rubrinervis]